jgi:hypothetical protein
VGVVENSYSISMHLLCAFGNKVGLKNGKRSQGASLTTGFKELERWLNKNVVRDRTSH